TVTLSCVNPSPCTLLGDTTVNAVNGVAQFTNIRTVQAGLRNIVLEAKSTNLLSTQSGSFHGNTAIPYRLDIANEVSTEEEGNVTPWTYQPIVYVLDENGAIVTSDNTTNV